ncbi:MAG TPA: hypothetical protein VKV21_03745 [Solirubrobacteraceae bacterium]|nr:hypothetical protein [Solirubrobacteraceae bacterium]
MCRHRDAADQDLLDATLVQEAKQRLGIKRFHPAGHWPPHQRLGWRTQPGRADPLSAATLTHDERRRSAQTAESSRPDG